MASPVSEKPKVVTDVVDMSADDLREYLGNLGQDTQGCTKAQLLKRAIESFSPEKGKEELKLKAKAQKEAEERIQRKEEREFEKLKIEAEQRKLELKQRRENYKQRREN